MASLLGWVGNTANRVANTVHNDVVKPIQRDVVQPAVPIANAAKGIANTAYHVGAIPVNTARTALAEVTHNMPAQISATNQTHQGFTALRQFGQGTAGMGYQLGQSVNPFGGDVYNRVHTPSGGLQKFALGNQPIPSIQNQYKTTKAQHGAGQANVEATLTALMDALGVRGGAKAAKLPEAGKTVASKAPVVAKATVNTAQKTVNPQAFALDQSYNKLKVQLDQANSQNSVKAIRQQMVSNRAEYGKVKNNNQGGFVKIPGGGKNELPPASSSNKSQLPALPSKSANLNNAGTSNALVFGKQRTINPSQPITAPTAKLPPKLPQTAEPTPLGVSSLPNSTKDYVKQQVDAQKLAAKSDIGKGAKIRQELKTKLIDSLAPIEDPVIKQVGRSGELNLRNQLDRSLRSPTIAGQFAEQHGLHGIIKSVPNVDEFNQLLIAKHAQDLQANGIKTGRNLPADQQLINDLGPKYANHSQALINYNHKLLDQTAKYGLISKETAAHLKAKYPNYVPFDRIFKDGELTGGGNGSGPASLSTQTVVQRIKGSERQVQPPLESILAKTHDVIGQGERNLAAQEIIKYKDLPGNPLGLVPLRTAADVNARLDAYKGLAELKPVRDSLHKEVGTATKNLVTLINRNKQLGPKILKTIKDGQGEVRKNAVSLANGEARAVNRTDSKRLSIGITESDVNEAFQQYLDGKPSLVRNMYEFLGNKSEATRVQTKLDSIKSEFDAVKQQRSDLFNEAKLHADAAAKGKATISFLTDGIKNVYETTPEVAAAAKSLNKEQLGILGKILSYPTRVLRLGATGANAAFAMANVTKDVASAFINSEHPLRASIGNPQVFLDALKAAGYHKSGSYGELVSQGAGGTSFDIARNAAKDTVKQVRADRNIGTKALYTVKHPGELLRAVEDTIGRSEEFGRAVQYFGNKQAALAKGKSISEAQAYGADAARNNTINFARAGEYGRVLNSVLPYLNAGVQGSRTLLRNVKDRPVATGTKIAVTAFMPVAVTTAWNLNSPERRAAYNDISEYEKQNNIIIVPPNPHKDPKTGRWNVIKIPVSQEIANLNNTVRNGVEAMAKDKGFNFAGMAGDLAGTATSLNAGKPRQLIGQITPQAIKPSVEALTNQNLFTGNKIVPDSQRNLSPQDQYGPYSSGTAKQLGKHIGVSPLMIDNTIRTATGGLGQNVVNLSDKALAKAGVIPQSDVKGQSLSTSISGRFNSAQAISTGTTVDNAVKQATDKLKQTTGYKNLPNTEKAKALNRLETDVKAAQYRQIDAKNQTGQYAPGYTGKQTKLTPRQAGLVTGSTDLSKYLTPATSGSKLSISPKLDKQSQSVLNQYSDTTARTKAFNTQNDAEYKYNQAKYNNDKLNGSLTRAQDIKTQASLNKDKVGSSFSKDTRDLLGLSKAEIYSLVTTDSNGKTILNNLLSYDKALTQSGVQTKNKLTDKYGNLNIAPKAAGSKSGKKSVASLVKSAKSANAKTIKTPKAPHIKVGASNIPKFKTVSLAQYRANNTTVGRPSRRKVA